MELRKREEDMLMGKFGPGPQKSMELLVAVGKVFDARDMVPVAASHLHIPELMLFPKGDEAKWGIEMTRKLVDGLDSFSVPTTLNPLILDLKKADALRIPKNFVDEIRPTFEEAMTFYERKEAIPNYSCTPFFDFFYRQGEHLGGAESIQVLFNNSVNGARSNRETGPTALAVAVSGVTPNYGMHLDEGRRGNVLFELRQDVDSRQFTDADYNALGYYAGHIASERIPVLNGLHPEMNETDLKYLCVPFAVSAGIPMIHIVGVTPEAPTVKQVFGGKEPKEKILIGKKELHWSYERLNTATTDEVEYIAIGCPHCSLRELRRTAQLLKGRKVHSACVLFIATSTIKYYLAKQIGIVQAIEECGGVVVKGMCPGSSIFGRYGKELAIGTVATNSSKNAHYIGAHSGGFVKTRFGSLEQCIEAAVKGRWRV